MRKLLQKILRLLAIALLKKYRPVVIGVTGSIGKSSAKEAIYAVVRSSFRVVRSDKNYNNEFGVPLTIIGARAGRNSILRWCNVIIHGLAQLLVKNPLYPEVLILELGADHPGDIKYLASFVKPKMGIITAISQSHLEFFGTIDAVAKEKAALMEALPSTGTAIVLADDDVTYNTRLRSRAPVRSYGLSPRAMVRAVEYDIKVEAGVPRGMSFKISAGGHVVPMFLPGVLGKGHVLAALAAASVGLALDMNLIDIASALQGYIPPPGRVKILGGIKHTILIDDTYNSSPRAAREAIEVLAQAPCSGKRIAALGDMLELGSQTKTLHEELGIFLAEQKIDLLVTSGEAALHFAIGAAQAGMSRDHIFSFSSASEAGKFLQERIKEGDVVLIKGSQGARMEKVTKELMAEPLRAKELLVRQDESWK